MKERWVGPPNGGARMTRTVDGLTGTTTWSQNLYPRTRCRSTKRPHGRPETRYCRPRRKRHKRHSRGPFSNDKLIDGKSEEDEVEIAILTGDEKVGVRSDRAIAAQLDEVVSAFQPDQAILVTDGAEDESVLPIITSQVRIDHVEKVIVRQSKGIEGTYYYIVKALEDPKWRSRIMIPFGAVLAIFGLGIMLPNEIGGVVIGALPLVLGLYIFSKGAGIESTVNRASSRKCVKTPTQRCFPRSCGRRRCSAPSSP